MNKQDSEAEVLVSVLCYNHGEYITQCLDSIFMQQCDFPYKVFVYDDVSTDNSWDIILEYKKKYDEKMTVYQPAHNQFSQGIFNAYLKTTHSVAKYKYVAICEGDDYWSSSDKLQKQYNSLEKNESCSLCVCATDYFDDMNQKWIRRRIIQEKNEVIPGEKAIIDTLRWGVFWGANTFFIRNKYLLGIDLDAKFWNYSGNDMSYILYLATQGNIFYLGEFLAVKRRYNKGSWSEREVKKEELKERFLKEIEWMRYFNEVTKRKFEDSVERYILWRKIRLYYIENGQVELNSYVNNNNGKLYKTEISRKINRLYIKIVKIFYKKDEMGFAKKERLWMEKEWKKLKA